MTLTYFEGHLEVDFRTYHHVASRISDRAFMNNDEEDIPIKLPVPYQWYFHL